MDENEWQQLKFPPHYIRTRTYAKICMKGPSRFVVKGTDSYLMLLSASYCVGTFVAQLFFQKERRKYAGKYGAQEVEIQKKIFEKFSLSETQFHSNKSLSNTLCMTEYCEVTSAGVVNGNICKRRP